MESPTPSKPLFSVTQLLPKLERVMAFARQYGRFTSVTRSTQIAETQRAFLFYKGMQYLVAARGVNGQPTWIPYDAPQARQEQDNAPLPVATTLNFFTHDVNLVSAILARGGPRATVASSDPRIPLPADQESAISRIMAVFDSQYNTTEVKYPLARWFLLCPGAIFAHVRPVADAGRYGVRQEPVYESQEMPGGVRATCSVCGFDNGMDIAPLEEEDLPCKSCGAGLTAGMFVAQPNRPMPVQVGMQTVPNVGVEVRFRNVLTTYVNPGAVSMDDVTWLVDHETLPMGRLVQRYKHARQILNLRPGHPAVTYDTQWESYVQQIVNSRTGQTDSSQNQPTLTHVWLDPCEYWNIPDHREGREVREVLQTYFSGGIRLTYLGDRLIDIADDELRHVWTFVTHDGQSPDATPTCLHPYFDGQTTVNDLVTQLQSAAMTTSTQIFVPTNLIDVDHLNMFRGIANHIWPIKPGMQERVQSVQVGQFPAELVNWLNMVISHTRQTCGVTDVIRGVADPETARAVVVMREQSLQAFQPMYQQLLRLMVRALELFILTVARYRMSAIWVPRAMGSMPSMVTIQNLGKVLQHGWVLTPDETVPMSRPDMRAQLLETISKLAAAPAILDALGFSYPPNAPALSSLLAIPGWTSQNANWAQVVRQIFDRIKGLPLPVELSAAPPEDPEGRKQWLEDVDMVLAEESSAVPVTGKDYPLQLVLQLGREMLAGPEMRELYAANYIAWLRCKRFLDEVELVMQQQQQQSPAASPEGAETGGAQAPPDGDQPMPTLDLNP